MLMNFVKRFVLSIMALVVFATSSCFAYDVHMCEDKVESQAFFSKAPACEKMSEMNKEELPECCRKRRDANIARSGAKLFFEKKACCYNHSFEFKSDQNQDAQGAVAVIAPVEAFTPNVFEYSIDFSDFEVEFDQPFRGPPPPDIRRDIHSLYQVFII